MWKRVVSREKNRTNSATVLLSGVEDLNKNQRDSVLCSRRKLSMKLVDSLRNDNSSISEIIIKNFKQIL